MTSFANRFYAVHDRASATLAEKNVCEPVLTRDRCDCEEAVRAVAFVASIHIRYASERVSIALASLGKQSDYPPTATQQDYERFVEDCKNFAEMFEVSSDVVADSLLNDAELAVCHAERALELAHEAYSRGGRILLFADPAAYRKEKAGLFDKHLVSPTLTRNPFFRLLLNHEKEGDRKKGERQ